MTNIDSSSADAVDASIKELSCSKAFTCDVVRLQHTAPSLKNLVATFTVILPPPIPNGPKPGLLLWLSGLTSTDDNFPSKAGAAPHCAKHNIAIAVTDTSPRNAGVPGEDDDWDLGTSASFYVDATAQPYASHYQMQSYLLCDLLPLLQRRYANDIDFSKGIAISGHSMGGCGALHMALRHRDVFHSVSAFAPISNPSVVPWGTKCFRAYLGDDEAAWRQYDPTCIMREKGGSLFDNILVDQGEADKFLHNQLKPDAFVDACRDVGQKVEFYMAPGYDHSYYFVQTFMEKHIRFHAKALDCCPPME